MDYKPHYILFYLSRSLQSWSRMVLWIRLHQNYAAPAPQKGLQKVVMNFEYLNKIFNSVAELELQELASFW
jgi:hypothetical protein